WSKRLGKRASATKGDSPLSALSWGVSPKSAAAERLARLGKALKAKPQKAGRLASEAEAWLEDLAGTAAMPSVDLALVSVGWAHAIAAAAPLLEGEFWWRVVDQLRTLAESAQQVTPGEEAPVDESLVDQLLAGEIPLVLAAVLPEISPLRTGRKVAAAALSEGVLALTDGEGLPPARCLPRLPLLLACWTRCRTIAESTSKRCWDADAETQYEWLVRQSLRLASADGAVALSEPSASMPDLLHAAIKIAGDEADSAAAARRLRPKPKKNSSADPPEPSVNSEWSGVAVLAAGWAPKAPRMTVAYAGSSMRLELMAGGQVAVSGDWPLDITIDGVAAVADGEWEEQCWFSDEESDYLELAIDLENGARLERQLFLTREDGIGYVSEIVMTNADEPAAIETNTRLVLGEKVVFHGEQETREGWLTVGKKRLAGMAPLALPEWRVDPRHGELTSESQTSGGETLGLSLLAVGRAQCSPLMLDFNVGRFAKQRTWRQLAVAEKLKRVGPDIAVGYRMQSGRDQWVVYRSLAGAANRTVIGGNYSSESFIGRFLPTGEIEEYWEIEAQ
ncbi:MAG: hypothetical protein AAF589_08015, partial [Planctomycetota bacterium]